MRIGEGWVLVSCSGVMEEVLGYSIDGSYEEGVGTPLEVVVVGVGDRGDFETALYCDRYRTSAVSVEVGDRVYVEWLGLYNAIMDDNLRVGGDFLIPYSSIICISTEDGVVAINGNVLVGDIERGDDYDRGLLGVKSEWVRGVVYHCDNIYEYFETALDEEVSTAIGVNVGDLVVFDNMSSFELEHEGYITLDRQYYYIKSKDILIIENE